MFRVVIRKPLFSLKVRILNKNALLSLIDVYDLLSDLLALVLLLLDVLDVLDLLAVRAVGLGHVRVDGLLKKLSYAEYRMTHQVVP